SSFRAPVAPPRVEIFASPPHPRPAAAKRAASTSEPTAAARRRCATPAAAAKQETEPEEENLSPVNRPMYTSLRVSEAAACRSMKTKEQTERNKKEKNQWQHKATTMSILLRDGLGLARIFAPDCAADRINPNA